MRQCMTLLAAAHLLVACQGQGDNSQAANGAARRAITRAGESALRRWRRRFLAAGPVASQPGSYGQFGRRRGEFSTASHADACLAADQVQRPTPISDRPARGANPGTYLFFDWRRSPVCHHRMWGPGQRDILHRCGPVYTGELRAANARASLEQTALHSTTIWRDRAPRWRLSWMTATERRRNAECARR